MSLDQCSFSGCNRTLKVRGYCRAHYKQLWRGGQVKQLKWQPETCEGPECDRPAKTKRLCVGHYNQQIRGRPLTALKFKSRNGEGGLSVQGYRRLTVDGSRVFEHRHVMEQALGRLLMDHENVHHRNGDRQDNRLQNLELWSSSQPIGQRIEDKIAWARELLAMYDHLAYAVASE